MPNPSGRRRGEAGSAYIVTLLALVVLTILALSLTLVTQSELQIGASEKTINRNFYSDESAMGVAANKIIFNDESVDSFIMNRLQIGSGSGSSNYADRVTLGPPTPVAIEHADLSMAAMGSEEFFRTAHNALARADRIKWNGDGLPPTNAAVDGTKVIVEYIHIQPGRKFDVRSLPGVMKTDSTLAVPPTP